MPMPDAMSNEDVQIAYEKLVAQVRTDVFLTLRNGPPVGSHVRSLLGDDWSRVYLHVSRLALQRLNLQGAAAILPLAHEFYDKVKQRYLATFPQSQMMFGQAYQAHSTAPKDWHHQKPEKKS